MLQALSKRGVVLIKKGIMLIMSTPIAMSLHLVLMQVPPRELRTSGVSLNISLFQIHEI